MLHEKDLPERFLGKAANTVVCLQNRISTKAVKDLTPFEVLYGYKPSLMFLRGVFASLTFHMPSVISLASLAKRQKLTSLLGIALYPKFTEFFNHTLVVLL